MKKVKILKSRRQDHLEEFVNEFLKVTSNVTDVQYTVFVTGITPYYTAMITYIV